jgi:adenylate kinase family enzyme
MICDYKSIEDALLDENLVPTKIGFITGRSSSGKTTFSKKLKEKGFHIVEFDHIAKTQVNNIFNLTQDQSIDIVRGKSSEEIENYFINKIHESIESALPDQKIIVEGTISNDRVLNKIFNGKFADYTFLFLYPLHKDKYLERIKKRFISDIENNEQTLPIWDHIDERILKEYSEFGFQSPVVSTYMDELLLRFFDGGYERYRYFKDRSFDIITIGV